MSQGGYVTLVGFVAQDPNLRTTKDGKVVTDVRVGATRRVHDKATNEWRDLETSYYDVSCWNRLAHHARASLHKGDPVMVKGQFKVSTFADRTGQLRSKVQIIADTVGHDLSRGVANYMRNRPVPENTDGDPAGNAAPENEGTSDLAGGSGVMIDEEAIERFGRDLDADLDQAELAVQALREDEEAEAATPF
jgi:single-strand DNA-binding protein